MVQDWVNDHQRTECSASEKSGLVAQIRPHVLHLHLSDTQLFTMVKNSLAKLRPVFQPEKTNKGCHKRAVGDEHGISSSE